MKANEAPEKIILSADRDTQTINDDWVLNDYTDNIKIEYTRTAAFIKKACEWIRDNHLKYPSEDCADTAKFIKDFKRYLKGE